MSERVDATDVECPTCGAWIGWACEGAKYGYHAAGYHRSRERAATAKEIVPAVGAKTGEAAV